MSDRDLASILGEFDAEKRLELATALPASWYTSPLIAERELETVFHQSWQAIVTATSLTNRGEFATGDLGRLPVVVSRDEKGTIHAFANVCRHRAALVACGEGKAERFTCPYHGWQYGLDGRLLAAPELGGVCDFDRHTQGLRSLAVEQVGPLLFANCGSKGTAIESPPSVRWAPLWKRLDATGWQALQLARVVRYSLNCNWKVFVDNYLDGGYHVAAVHPGLAGQLELDSYKTEVFEDYSVQSCGGASGRIGSEAIYAFLYPNFMINRYGDAMDVNLVLPRGANACEVVFAFYFAPEVLADSRRVEAAIASSDQVQREDVWICESVQRGLASGGYIPGRYSVIRQGAERAFHVRLARELAGKSV